MTIRPSHPTLVRVIALSTAVAAGVAITAAPAIAVPHLPGSAEQSATSGTYATADEALATAAAVHPGGSGVLVQDHRGEMVSAIRIRGLSQPQVVAELTDAGFDPGSTRFGVDLYRLVYRTLDERGRPTTASGLVGRAGLSSYFFSGAPT